MTTFIWSKNPDLDKLMRFEDDPYGVFESDESRYQLVWYLDPRVNPLSDKVWAMKCTPLGKTEGTKDMGYLLPKINIEYNKDLPDLGVDFDKCYPAYWELKDICVWELDPIHITDERIWVAKYSPAYRKSKKWEWYGLVSPTYNIEYNPALPNLKLDINYNIPFHNLAYEHIWYLEGDEKIWAAKVCATNNPIGTIQMDHDPLIFSDLDVIFISYNESNAETNWQRVLEKAPHAKRVDGVKGIFEAHKAAAQLSTTDMFYVVDGDAYLVDEMNFDFQPSIYDRDCTHIWRAKNPINELVYGYGGVKLFSKQVLMDAQQWVTLDLSTSVISKIKIVNTVSNITAFDTDELSVWRSAFRECVKLCYNIISNTTDTDSRIRLDTWLTVGNEHQYGTYAMSGAAYAVKWADKHKDDYESLRMINSREWIVEQFELNKGNLNG